MTSNRAGYSISAKGTVYFNTSEVRGADGRSFQQLNDIWAMDGRNVYAYGQRVGKADRNSFQVLNHLYAKDSNHAYYLGGIIKGADAQSFVALDTGECLRQFHNGFGDPVFTQRSIAGFAADDTKVFHYVLTIGKPCVLRDVDRKSFEVLGQGFGRDKESVYFEKSRLKGTDTATFEVIPPLWGKDKNAVFYGATRLDGAEPRNFAVLSSCDFLATDQMRYFERHLEIAREQAFPHGSRIPGYPLNTAKDVAQLADYLNRGATPHDRLTLHSACRKGQTEIVKLLLDAGCDPSITDSSHNSCLTELYGDNCLEIARLLIAAGANVNHIQQFSPEQHGKLLNAAALYSPLQFALSQKRLDLADLLLSHGADVNPRTSEGIQLIDYFRRLEDAVAVAYLTKHGA